MKKIVNGVEVQMTDAEIAEVHSQWEAEQEKQALLSYAINRQYAYPSIQEQLDMLWHSVNNGIGLKDSDWFAQLKSVKDTYEKPTA